MNAHACVSMCVCVHMSVCQLARSPLWRTYTRTMYTCVHILFASSIAVRPTLHVIYTNTKWLIDWRPVCVSVCVYACVGGSNMCASVRTHESVCEPTGICGIRSGSLDRYLIIVKKDI